MSFALPMTNPDDYELLTAARKQLDAIKKSRKPEVGLIVLLKTVQFIARFAQLIVIARLLAEVVLQKALPGNYTPLILLIFLASVHICIGYLIEKASTRFSTGISEYMRVSILESLENGLLDHKFKQKIGGAILFLGKQSEAIAPYFTRYLPQKTLSLIAPLITLGYVFTISWVCGAIILFTVPIVPVYMILIGKGTATASRNEWKDLTEMGGYFYDRIKGITTLYIFGNEETEIKKVREASEKYKESALRVLKMAFLSAAAIDFFSTVIIAGIAIVIGLSLIGYIHFGIGETFNLGNSLTLLMVVPEFFVALKKLGAYYHDRSTAIAAMMNFQEAGLFGASESSATGDRSTNVNLPSDTGVDLSRNAIDLQNVFFRYPCAEILFNDFTLSLKWGEKLLIKGSNGSGKSTLLDLLNGFQSPISGKVYIGGLDTSSVKPDQISHILGWAGQQSRIFKGTLRYNLCMGKDIADSTIYDALSVYFDWESFMTPYSEGLDALIEEDGKSISGGERHKISLARVILKDTPVLLLDEPFTHLDQISATRFINALSANKQRKTIVLVTHNEEHYQLTNFSVLTINDQS